MNAGVGDTIALVARASSREAFSERAFGFAATAFAEEAGVLAVAFFLTALGTVLVPR